MRPPEVLDHQAALLDYLGSAYYRGFMHRFVDDMIRKGKIDPRTNGAALADQFAASLRIAQAVHVQRDMMPLVRAAALDLDDADHLVHSRVPAEHGFLMFDDPWLAPDVWGEQTVTAAIQWWHGTTRDQGRPTAGIWIVQYTDLTDERDAANQRLLEEYGHEVLNQLGRLHVNHLWFLPYKQPVGPMERPSHAEYAQFATDGLALAATYPNFARLIVALFRLLTQVIVDVSDAPIDRATARRVQRKNLPVRVQTVKLRRKEKPATEPHGEGHVEWQHSWVVRGHWAWRKCNADHPLAEPYEKGWHARVYIAPYFKGPDDKPLQVSEKVWGLAQ